MSGLNLQPLSAASGTPADEWASQTTNSVNNTRQSPAFSSSNAFAVNPTTADLTGRTGPAEVHTISKNPFETSSTTSTPGHEFPGAFPSETAKTAGMTVPEYKGVADTATNAVQNAGHAAAQYIPKGIVDTVSSYMPGSTDANAARASEHDAVHATSFPSTEFTGTGTREHLGGVGSLPGAVTESSVPKLPEERASNEQYSTLAGITAGAQHAFDKTRVNAQTAASAAINAAPTWGSAATTSLPSTEHIGTKPYEHQDGVGALPGMDIESGVAILPDESSAQRMHDGTNMTSSAIATYPLIYGDQVGLPTIASQASLPGITLKGRDEVHKQAAAGGVGNLPGRKSEEGVAILPEERALAHSGTAAHPTTQDHESGARTGISSIPGDTREQGAAVRPEERAQSGGAETKKDAVKEEVRQKMDVVKDTAKAGVSGNKDGEKQVGDRSHSSSSSDSDGSAREEEKRIDSRKVTLTPREHSLGTHDAHWGGINVGDAYKRGEGVDIESAHDREGSDRQGVDKTSGYHPAQIHPQEEKSASTPAAHTDPVANSKSDAHADDAPQHDHEDDKAVGHKKKAGFMDKMRGEAKVLLGKVERKGEMVEEGKRMKAGNA